MGKLPPEACVSPVESAPALPEASVAMRKWHDVAIWSVPALAALVAAYLALGSFREYGPLITLRFRDGTGIRIEQTEIEYRGVPVGTVKDMELSADHQFVLVKVRLRRSAAAIARQGSEFWIVRLQTGLANTASVGAAVGTVFSGPYIDVLPGTGPPATEFVGLDKPPAVKEKGALRIVLRADRVHSVRPGMPLLYRGVQVGAVQDFQLDPAATGVTIQAEIEPEYARLVRSNSLFRNVSGASVRFGLLRGLDIEVQSLGSLIAGAIAFSTPNDPRAKPASDGMEFRLLPAGRAQGYDEHRTRR